MKNAVLGFVAMAFTGVFAAPALAADFTPPPATTPSPQPPAPAPQFSWSGFYAGVQVGLGSGAWRYPYTGPGFTGDITTASSGLFAGGQVGYNMQRDRAVFGVEADINWSGIGGGLALFVDDGAGSTLTLAGGSTIDYFGTLRLRAGWLATERLLVYATGGLAYGQTTSGWIATGTGGFAGLVAGASTSAFGWGWAAGGGTEFMINDRLSLRTQYLYVDLGTSSLVAAGGGGFTLDVATRAHTLSAGLNLAF